MGDSLNAAQFGYHVAARRNREKIERNGLRPGEDGNVWMFTDRSKATTGSSGNFEVWRANLTGMKTAHGSKASSEWYDDDPVVVTGKRIKPGRLKREQ